MQVVRTHVPPPSSLSGCLSEMQVLLDCLRPLRRAHFTRTEVKIVVHMWIPIWSGPYTPLSPLRRMSRYNVHLHPKQSHYCKQKSITNIPHPQKIRYLAFRSNRPYRKHLANTRWEAMYVQNLAPSRNHCEWKISWDYIFFVCVCVAFIIQHAKRMRRVLSPVACLALTIFFHIISEHNTLLIPSIIQRDITNAHTSSCRVPVILAIF
jgi:hypothetical protein